METVFTYNATGQRISKLDPNQNTILYGYDQNNRLTDITYPDLTRTHFDYDRLGRKTWEENAHTARTYSYDSLNRVSRVVDEILGKAINYGYDQNGNRAKMVVSSGETTTYRYDALNRIKEFVDPDGGKSIFEYNRTGQRASLKFANGMQGSYLYDNTGRVEKIVYKTSAGAVLDSFAYTHDRVGNRLSKAFENGQRESYGYDPLHRLVLASYSGTRGGVSVRPGWEPAIRQGGYAGRFPETTDYTYSDFNQVLSTTNSTGTTTYTWDDNGNLTGKNEPATGVTQYRYDFENRLVGISFAGGQTNAFGYDPQGIRTFKDDSQGRHNYLLDQASVLAEFDAAGTRTPWFTSIRSESMKCFLRCRSEESIIISQMFLTSVHSLVGTTETKEVIYSFDAFGVATVGEIHQHIGNNWLFTGREFDKDSRWHAIVLDTTCRG